MSWAARRRALRRVGLVVAVVALVALATVTVLRLAGARKLAASAQRFEATVGPLDFEAYRPAEVPDSENASLPILEALDRLDLHGDAAWRGETAWLHQANRRPAAAWSAEDWTRAGALLDRSGDVLEPLDRARGRSGASFDLDYAAGPGMEIPNLLRAIEAADLLMARARVAWNQGNPDDGVVAIEALAALAHALEAESPLVFQLMGHNIEVLQYRAIQDAVALRSWRPDDLPRLRRLAVTAEEHLRQDELRRALVSEAALLYSVRPDGKYAEVIASQRRWPRSFTYRWQGYDLVASGLDYYTRVAKTYPSLTAKRLTAEADATRPPRNGLDSLIIMNLRPTLTIFGAVDSLRHLARQALDVADKGAAAGALPEALPAPPAVDPFFGVSAVYERAPDGSATLTLPGGDDTWERTRPSQARSADDAPLFTWTLAAPAASERRSGE